MMRLKVLGIAAAVVGGLGFVTVANAAPFVPGPIGPSDGEARIEQVRDGCGWGGHRNIYGECRADLPSRPRYYGGYGGGYGGYGGAYGGYGVYGGGYGRGYYRPRPYYGYGPRPFF